MPPIKRLFSFYPFFFFFLLIVVKNMSAKARALGGGATWHVASGLCPKGKRLY